MDFTPTRWNEPTRLPPWGARLRWIRPAIPPSDPRVTSLREALLETDPLADDVATWLRDRSAQGARGAFERAVEQGPAAYFALPEPARALFDQVDSVPLWADPAKLRLGSETLLRAWPAGSWSLAGFALAGGYLAGATVKPLVMTGALSRMAYRRLAETTRFVLDVATSPGLERSSDGFKTTLRVRVMHAQVRAGLQASGRWKTRDWGMPINQQDMLATILQFSVAYAYGLRALGVVLTARERDALMLLWRYVGFVMGVRQELLPTTFDEAASVYRLVAQTQMGPDDDSRALMAALLHVPRERRQGRREVIRGEIEARFLGGYVRYVLGDEAGDLLGVPDGPWKIAPALVAPAIFGLEMVRALVPGAQDAAIRFGRSVAKAHVERMLEGKGPTYSADSPHAPEHALAH
ncbi:MAG: oxygenase MpaB family protein [Polyangiaceae bacterium]